MPGRREEDGVFAAALVTLTTAQWDAVDALRIGCPLWTETAL
jgi:hypothetical protein